METLSREIGQLTQQFVGQVAELSVRHAQEALAQAVAGSAGSLLATRGRPRRPNGEGESRLSAGQKRPPDVIEQARRRFALFVQGNPGLRIEQINRELGTRTSELALPIRQLVAQGAILTEGHRRSTKYRVGPNFDRHVSGATGAESDRKGAQPEAQAEKKNTRASGSRSDRGGRAARTRSRGATGSARRRAGSSRRRSARTSPVSS